MQLEGKRVILTGGGSGIGATTVTAFAREGAAIVALDIQEKAGRAVVAEAAGLGPGPISYMRCDISKQQDVNTVFDEAVAQLGGLDVMLNIAGNERNVAAEDVNETEIDFIMDVHVKGTMFTNAAAFRHMKDAGGSIVNYTSLAGISGYPGNPIYGAAKGAVVAWTRNIAKEWGRYRIRANAVAPFVMTPMAQLAFDQVSAEELEGIKAWFKMMVPLGGWLGETEDAANANIFLASDASSFITGQILSVDGGFVMVR
jgi:NAD(P)-dependent dehydrogenase (short-subunit alcohol dehydrogenase family)